MKHASAYGICLLSILLALAETSPTQVAIGTPPLGSFGGGPFDVVNLGSLNVHFAIPVFQRSGRGTSLYYNLTYDSSVWVPVTSAGVTNWNPVGGWGWQSQTNAATGYLPAPTITYPLIDCGTPPRHIWEQYELDTYPGFVDPMGTFHSVGRLTVTYPALDCGSQVGSTRSTWDGSGYTVTVVPYGSATVTPRNGAKWIVPSGPSGPATVTDDNGNQIKTTDGTTFYDTLSATQAALTISGNAPNPVSYNYTGPQGTVGYTMNYLPYTVKTGFGATLNGTAIAEYGPTTISLVDNVTQPDGSKYSFTYETTPVSCTPNSGTQPTCVTGRIATVTLPSGGTITYNYTGGANGIENDGSTSGLTRQLSNVATHWSYSRANISGSHWQTTINDPSTPTNQTVIDFQKDSLPVYPTPNFYETQRLVYQGSATGTPLSTTISCYNGNSVSTPANCPSTGVATPILRTTVFRYLPTTSGQQAETDTTLDSYGLTHEVDEYDYGTGAVGALLRKTITAYATLGNSIVDRPSSVTIEDSGNNILAQTSYSYDETTPTPTTGSPQHVSVTGSRGLPTTVTTKVNATTSLYRKLSYYDTGTLNTSTDVSTSNTTNGPTTTYNYAAGSASCGNSFVTSITEPLGLSPAMTWDCNGGVEKSVTDPNNQPTQYGYTDPFWRVTSITDPLTNVTTTSYTSTSVDTMMLFNSNGSTTETVTTLDGFGRKSLVQKRLSPTSSLYDTVQYAYDANGRLYSVSQPCQVALGTGCSTAVTSFGYDAADRPVSTNDGGGGTVADSYTGNDLLTLLSG